MPGQTVEQTPDCLPLAANGAPRRRRRRALIRGDVWNAGAQTVAHLSSQRHVPLHRGRLLALAKHVRKRTLTSAAGGFASVAAFQRSASSSLARSNAPGAAASGSSATLAATAAQSACASASSSAKSTPRSCSTAIGRARRAGRRRRKASWSRATSPKGASAASVVAIVAKCASQSRSMALRRAS